MLPHILVIARKKITITLITKRYLAAIVLRLRFVYPLFFLWKMHEPAQLNNMHNVISIHESITRNELGFAAILHTLQIAASKVPMRRPCFPEPHKSAPAAAVPIATEIILAERHRSSGTRPLFIRLAKSSDTAAVIRIAIMIGTRRARIHPFFPFTFKLKNPLRETRCHYILFSQRGSYSVFD